MKKKEFIIIYFAVLLLGVLFTFSALPPAGNIYEIDKVVVNEIIKLTERNWGNVSDSIYHDTDYDFTVINLNGDVIFSTIDKQSKSYSEYINEAIDDRDTLVDIIVKDELVGKLIIKYNMDEINAVAREKMKMYILAFYAVVAAVLLIYYIYLDRKVFRPFHTMKQFASRIAAGNLDTPIEMDKKNSFGAFTESFDLMREALKTARHNEYLANKSKKELVAALSHDIKNPVASIKAISETMMLTSDDPHINTIRQKAEQVDGLVNDLFASTLEELGELKVVAEEHSSQILHELLTDMNFGYKIHIKSLLPECIILCDEVRLTQVIDNILGNSYKYAGTPIEVTFELNDIYLKISIKDFGKGITEEELPLIFEKFYRGKNADGKEGSGLGLYLSKLFIIKMGGQIECHNEADGFVVNIELRLAGS